MLVVEDRTATSGSLPARGAAWRKQREDRDRVTGIAGRVSARSGSLRGRGVAKLRYGRPSGRPAWIEVDSRAGQTARDAPSGGRLIEMRRGATRGASGIVTRHDGRLRGAAEPFELSGVPPKRPTHATWIRRRRSLGLSSRMPREQRFFAGLFAKLAASKLRPVRPAPTIKRASSTCGRDRRKAVIKRPLDEGESLAGWRSTAPHTARRRSVRKTRARESPSDGVRRGKVGKRHTSFGDRDCKTATSHLDVGAPA